MVYFTHSLTSPELVMEFVEEYEGHFYYRIYCDRSHPIFQGSPEADAQQVSYAIIYHKEKGFRFMEESDLFKRGYDVGSWLFFMINQSTAMRKCRDRTPAPGLFRSYTSDKHDHVGMEVARTRKLLKQEPRLNINGLRLGQTRREAFISNSRGNFQFYNNLVVTPLATCYDTSFIDFEFMGKGKGKEKGERKRTVDDAGLDYIPGNYASTAEYRIQCGDHTISITYSNGYFY